MNVFNNVILARNRQLPDDDRMIETCRSIFTNFNLKNLSVCIGWCADQMISILHLCIGSESFCNISFLKHLPEDDNTCGRNVYEASYVYNVI